MNRFWIGVLPILWFLCVRSFAEMTNQDAKPGRIPIRAKHDQSEGDRIRIFYDKKKNVIAYKDSSKKFCFLETETSSAGKMERARVKMMMRSAYEPQIILDRKNVKKLAGKKILRFCEGLRTSLLQKPDSNVENEKDAEEVGEKKNWRKGKYKREKRQIRPRFRGQTQSQFMSFGDGKGSAEAVSQPDVSKTIVSGVNGIGQAQSQSGGRDCEGCYPEGSGTLGRRFEIGRPEGETTGSNGVGTFNGRRGIPGAGAGPAGPSILTEGKNFTMGGRGRDSSADFAGSGVPGRKDFSETPGGTSAEDGGLRSGFPGGNQGERAGGGAGTGAENGARAGAGAGAGAGTGTGTGTGAGAGAGGRHLHSGTGQPYPPNGGSRFSPSSQDTDFSRTNGRGAGTTFYGSTGERYPPSASSRPHSSIPGQTNERFPPSSSSKPYYPSSEDRRPGNGNIPPSSGEPSFGHGTGGRFAPDTSGHVPKEPFRPAENGPSYRYPPSSYAKPLHPGPDQHGPDRARPLRPSSDTDPRPPVRYPPSSSSKPYYPPSGSSSHESGRIPGSVSSLGRQNGNRPGVQNGFRPERYPPSAFSKSLPPYNYPPSSHSRVPSQEVAGRYYPGGGRQPPYNEDGTSRSRNGGGYDETEVPCETDIPGGTGGIGLRPGGRFPPLDHGREGEGYDGGSVRPSPSGGGRRDFRPGTSESEHPRAFEAPDHRPGSFDHGYPSARPGTWGQSRPGIDRGNHGGASHPSGGGYDGAGRPEIHGDPSGGSYYGGPKRPDERGRHPPSAGSYDGPGRPGVHRLPSGGGYDTAGFPETHPAGPSIGGGGGHPSIGRPGVYRGISGGGYDGSGGHDETGRSRPGGEGREGGGRPGAHLGPSGGGYDGQDERSRPATHRGHDGAEKSSGGSHDGAYHPGTHRGPSFHRGPDGGGRDGFEGKDRPEIRGGSRETEHSGRGGRPDDRGVGYDSSGRVPSSGGTDRSDTRPGPDEDGTGRQGAREGSADGVAGSRPFGSLSPEDGSRRPGASERPEVVQGGAIPTGGLPGGKTGAEGEGTVGIRTSGSPGGIGGGVAEEGGACSRDEGCKGGEESQVQTSVTQDGNATRALSSAQGRFGAGIAQAQVSGIYTGSGSFSAQAQTSDNDKGAQVQVIGGSRGASSSAQGMGGRGQTQAQVQLGSKNGATSAEAQSGGIDFVTNTQVQAGARGGSADAQADGPGRTSSQAQIGFTPFANKTDKEKEQKVPFQGGVSASAQSGANVGQSQTELFGSFHDGISYTGSAQAGSGKALGKSKQTNSSFVEGIENDKESMTQIGFSNKRGLLPLPKFGQGILKGFKVDDLPDENIDLKKTNVSGEVPDLVKETSEKKEETVSTARNPKTGGNYSKEKSKPVIDKDAEILETKDKEEEEESDDDEYDEEEEEDYDETADLKAKPVKYTAGKGIETRFGSVVEKDETITVKQKSPTQSQTVFIGGLDKKHDVLIEQDADENVKEGDVLQPGDRILGKDGFTVPQGYRGKVTSVAGQIGKTRASAPEGGRAQSQTVLVKPGTGKVHYTNPKPYRTEEDGFARPSSYVNQPGPLARLQNDKIYHAPYASSSIVNNGQKRHSQTYYTKSSGCGYYTFSCDVVFGSNGRAKICKPNPPTNPDGTPCII